MRYTIFAYFAKRIMLRRLPKFTKFDQHGERPFKLAIQVNLIPCWHLQAIRGIGNAESLLADGIAMLQLDDMAGRAIPASDALSSLEGLSRGGIREPIIGRLRQAILPILPCVGT